MRALPVALNVLCSSAVSAMANPSACNQRGGAPACAGSDRMAVAHRKTQYAATVPLVKMPPDTRGSSDSTVNATNSTSVTEMNAMSRAKTPR